MMKLAYVFIENGWFLNGKKVKVSKTKVDIEIYKILFKPFIIEQMSCCMLMLLYSVTSIIFPYFMKLIIDDAIGNNDVSKLILYVISMLITIIIMLISQYYQSLKFLRLGQKVIYKLKQMILDKLMHYSSVFFTKYNTGDIISIIENDVASVEKLTTNIISDFLVNSITVIGLFVMLYNMSIQITIMLIPLVIGYAYFQRLFGFKVRSDSLKLSEEKGEIYTQTQQIITNIEEIKKINSNQYFIEKYVKCHETYFQNEKKVVIRGQVAKISGTIFQSVGLLLVLCLGGISVLNGDMTLGVLFSLTLYVQRIFSPIVLISRSYIEYKKVQASIERVFELLSQDYYLIEENKKYDKQPLMWDIKFKNLSFGYNGNELVRNVNLTINEGDKIALLGENGSGKTTLIKILLRIQKEYSGEILFNQSLIEEFSFECFRKNVCCIGQKPFVFNGTILENIIVNNKGISQNEIQQIIHWVCLEKDIKHMPNGLNTIIGEKGVILSGGQAQKIAIARAFVLNPMILILDEPTSALDVESEKEICKNIFNYFSDRTVITITHRKEILKYCTRILEIINQIIQENSCA